MLAPDVFDCDDRGFGLVKQADIPPELEKQARHAAANCPEQAIVIS